MDRNHSYFRRIRITSLSLLLISLILSPVCSGLTLEELAVRVETLEAENRELKAKITRLEAGQSALSETVDDVIDSPREDTGFVRFDNRYSYEMLDPTTRINRKQQLILEKKQSGELPENSVTLGGAVTAIADVQHSNTDSKFGYLMRHPTAANQRTKDVSEAVLHSVQIAVTGNMGSWVTAYGEILYDPEQSFGSGTITSLTRNQLQLRRGYVLIGNLDEAPLFLSLGKMATPFGLTDTVNPFTASTVWHAFGGLAYGVQAGYVKDGLTITLMGVQGGAQFRSHNTSVDDSNVPSKLNNYVVDANYTIPFGDDDDSIMVGASYTKGSAYCHDFPVLHFDSCRDHNPAYDLYAQLHLSDFLLHAEYAETTDEWPGTFNPTIPQFPAHEVVSWNLGGKYSAVLFDKDVDLSIDFSRFIAGPSGAPWENQDQLVLGIAGYITPSVKLFGEYIHTEGFVPLNFISGGNLGDGVTHSDSRAESDIFLMGFNAAF